MVTRTLGQKLDIGVQAERVSGSNLPLNRKCFSVFENVIAHWHVKLGVRLSPLWRIIFAHVVRVFFYKKRCTEMAYSGGR